MLPPDLAAFTFTLDPAGGDVALAERAAAALGGTGSIAVAGAQRRRLIVDLVRRGLAVTAFDASRAVLEFARAGLEDERVADRVTLFATDPRDAEIPGGVDAALVTSAFWRILLHESAQSGALVSLRRALTGPSLLLLDVDRVPAGLPAADWAPLREGPGRQRWSARRGGDVVSIRCESPGVPTIPLDLSAISPEASLAAVEAAGFRVVSVTDGSGAPFGPSSARLWLVAAGEGA